MPVYKVYNGHNFPTTYLVMKKGTAPEITVPFNVLHLFGDLSLVKGAVRPSFLPFAQGGRKRIQKIIEERGFCFYKWPGKILGPTLGDILEIPQFPALPQVYRN